MRDSLYRELVGICKIANARPTVASAPLSVYLNRPYGLPSSALMMFCAAHRPCWIAAIYLTGGVAELHRLIQPGRSATDGARRIWDEASDPEYFGIRPLERTTTSSRETGRHFGNATEIAQAKIAKNDAPKSRFMILIVRRSRDGQGILVRSEVGSENLSDRRLHGGWRSLMQTRLRRRIPCSAGKKAGNFKDLVVFAPARMGKSFGSTGLYRNQTGPPKQMEQGNKIPCSET
jgi:hypothetical protein